MNSRSENFSLQMTGAFLGLCLLILGLFFSHGIYQAYWLWTLPAAALLIFFGKEIEYPNLARLTRLVLPSTFFLIAAISMTKGFGQLGNLQASEPDREWLVTAMQVFYIGAGVTAFICLKTKNQQTAQRLFVLTILLSSLALVFLLFASPRPWIDVWSVQENAANALLHGKNPYTLEYLNIYPQSLQPILNPFGNPFVYLPGVLFILAPFKWLGLDTRIAFILANAATAFLLASLEKEPSKTNGNVHQSKNYFIALLFLALPFMPYLIDQAWNDSLTVVFIALCAYALQRRSLPVYVLALVGMSLIKQHIFLVLPFLIYYGSRHLDRSVIKIACSWAALFTLACLPFALWDWQSFVGSLWGFHALTHASGQALPNRVDGFSLLNWLTRNIGYRPQWAFAFVGLALFATGFLLAKKMRNIATLFNYCAGALLLVFAAAPLAFINYYFVCIGFLACAAAGEWETKPSPKSESEPEPLRSAIFKPWPHDLILFGISRCLLLFSTLFFQSETTFYRFFAAERFASFVPIQNFGYRLMPGSLGPMSLTHFLQALIPSPTLITYRTTFVLLALITDSTFYVCVRKRCAKRNLFLYAVASALLFDQFYDHVELWAGLLLTIELITERQSRSLWPALLSPVAFAFQWTSGLLVALTNFILHNGKRGYLSRIGIAAGTLLITAFTPLQTLSFFTSQVTEPNPESLWRLFPQRLAALPTNAAMAFSIIAAVGSALILYREKRRSQGKPSLAPYLVVFSFVLFDPLAGTGALILLVPIIALTSQLERRNFLAPLLLLTCLLRTAEFHQLLPAIGISQICLLFTYLASLKIVLSRRLHTL